MNGAPAGALGIPGRVRPGEWLRKQRVGAGLTQEDLAERSGVSVRAIADLERGRTRRPYPSSVRALARALGLPETAGAELVARYRAGGDGGGGPADRSARRGRRRPRVPRQLPSGVAHFAGRGAELAALDAVLGGGAGGGPGVVISAIGGTAGVGKTALALQWAHQVADRFPDGQLYANLRGFDAGGGQPTDPADVLRGFLDAFGVHPERIPHDTESLAALYRSVLAGRRMLVLLDNAADVAQVRPLLPASPECLVIVTSRRELSALAAREGALLVQLDVLSAQEANELLVARLGAERAAAEPWAVTELATLCARLPLALSVIVARAAAAPRLPLAALAAELTELGGRLDALDVGDPAANVRTVLSLSYRHLPDPAARMFRLLGLHPGPDISAAAAASLAGLPAADARVALRDLVRASLLNETVPGRYAFHDLLRAYAAEQSALTTSAAGVENTTRRMLDHYLHTAHHAHVVLYPGRELMAPAARRGRGDGRVVRRQGVGAGLARGREPGAAQGRRAGGVGRVRRARVAAAGRALDLPQRLRALARRRAAAPDSRWRRPSAAATSAGRRTRCAGSARSRCRSATSPRRTSACRRPSRPSPRSATTSGSPGPT